MNQPDRYERFIVPDGVEKAKYVADAKLPNTGRFEIQREDHTLGNLMRMRLLGNPRVVFAAYRIPHPLNPLMVTRIQTDGHITPQAAMKQCLHELKLESEDLEQKYRAELERMDRTGPRDMSIFNTLGGRDTRSYDQQQQPQQQGYTYQQGGYRQDGYYQ